jgi:predicted MFS family arabinose efflux permease
MSSAETAVGAGAPTQPEAAAASGRFGKGYRTWLLALLLVINVLNLADRQGIAATAPRFKVDLGLTDTQLGLLQGFGFALFYTLFSLPLALMADRINRARIISACVAVFAGFAALCGVAQNFWQMMLFRIGIGTGDAGFYSPVQSVIGDHYPPARRTSATTVIWLGAPIGAVVGSVGGGWFAQYVGWRQWFFALAVPAVVVALVSIFTLREPVRGMSDPQGPALGKPPTIGVTFRFLMSKRSFVHVLIGAALAATAMNGIGQFLARFLVSNHHLGFAAAGKILGEIAGVSMAAGLALGGFGMDWLAKRDRRWYVWGPAIGLVLTTPLFIWGFMQADITLMIWILIAGHVTLFVYFTPTLGLAANMVSANMRGAATWMASLVLSFVGVGLGPTVVGMMSDFFAQQAFTGGSFKEVCPAGQAIIPALSGACSSASAAGVKHAVMAVALVCLWAAVHFLIASRHLRKDLDTHFETAGA